MGWTPSAPHALTGPVLFEGEETVVRRPRRMQCKDISTVAVLRFLAEHSSDLPGDYRVCTHWRWDVPGRWDVPAQYRVFDVDGIVITHPKPTWMPTIADVAPPGTPEYLLLVKMRNLYRKDYVDGCDCGCRGDWRITPKGIAFLRKHDLTCSPPPDCRTSCTGRPRTTEE